MILIHSSGAFRQVEDALGPVWWGDVSPESRPLFEMITYDEVVHGG